MRAVISASCWAESFCKQESYNLSAGTRSYDRSRRTHLDLGKLRVLLTRLILQALHEIFDLLIRKTLDIESFDTQIVTNLANELFTVFDRLLVALCGRNRENSSLSTFISLHRPTRLSGCPAHLPLFQLPACLARSISRHVFSAVDFVHLVCHQSCEASDSSDSLGSSSVPQNYLCDVVARRRTLLVSQIFQRQ